MTNRHLSSGGMGRKQSILLSRLLWLSLRVIFVAHPRWTCVDSCMSQVVFCRLAECLWLMLSCNLLYNCWKSNSAKNNRLSMTSLMQSLILLQRCDRTWILNTNQEDAYRTRIDCIRSLVMQTHPLLLYVYSIGMHSYTHCVLAPARICVLSSIKSELIRILGSLWLS